MILLVPWVVFFPALSRPNDHTSCTFLNGNDRLVLVALDKPVVAGQAETESQLLLAMVFPKWVGVSVLLYPIKRLRS
jgi:hypothetical protein